MLSCAAGVLLSMLAGTGARAEGAIEGSVRDAGGRPLAGAVVWLAPTQRTASTDQAGRYRLEAVPAGTHSLRASLLGYVAEAREVTVEDGGTARADFALQADLLRMQETVVVAAPVNPHSVLESSVAVTTLDERDIATRAPRSAADLFKAIPGLWVESSVGTVLNDVFVRGIPTGGQTRFLGVMEDGMPLFPGGDIAFMESDQFLRLDATVERVEAIRGGSASVLASNAPGGIINVVSRAGTSTLSGLVEATTSTDDLARLDFNVGGPLGGAWQFNVGGFARSDDGTIDHGFAADEGWQLKANATRLFGNSLLRLYLKALDDRNYVNAGGPYAYAGGALGDLPGFELGKDSYASPDLNGYDFPLPGGGTIRRDGSDGSSVEQFVLGVDLDADLGGGWILHDSLRFVDSDARVDFDLDFQPPIPLAAFGGAALATIGPLVGATGFQYSYAASGAPITDLAGLNGNGLLASTLPVFSDAAIDSVSNQLELRRDFQRHQLTLGALVSDVEMDRVIRSSFVLKEIADRPRLLDLTLTGSPFGPIPLTAGGFVSLGTSYEHDRVDGRIYALFVDDVVSIGERLRLDVGARYEWHELDNRVEDVATMDLDGNPLTVFDASYTNGLGTFTPVGLDLDDWGASVGLNYLARDDLALFARVSRGFNALVFDKEPGGRNMHISQLETGVKLARPKLAVFAALFYTDSRNVPFLDLRQLPGGTVVSFTNVGNGRTIGTELEVAATLPRGFGVRTTATLQYPEYNEFKFIDPGSGMLLDFSGNVPARQPKLLLDVTPFFEKGGFRAYLGLRYYGDRWANDRNTVELDAYTEVHGGLAWTRGSITVALSGSNLFDERALTTGNPMFDESVPAGALQPGTPLTGRAGLAPAARLSLQFRF